MPIGWKTTNNRRSYEVEVVEASSSSTIVMGPMVDLITLSKECLKLEGSREISRKSLSASKAEELSVVERKLAICNYHLSWGKLVIVYEAR